MATINLDDYEKGQAPKLFIYPFFMVHMLAFGGSGFAMAYAKEGPPILFLYAHGGFAIFVYVIFYLSIFGVDEVKWMFINAGLGFLGIYTQIDWILSKFDRQVSDYPFYVHVIPFLYFVLYTFLLHNAVLDLARARNSPVRRKIVDVGYVVTMVVLYFGSDLIRS